MNPITRDFLLGLRPASNSVHVEALGGTVFLRELPVGEVLTLGDAPKADQPFLILVAALTDAEGVPLFTAADVPALKQLPSAAFKALSEAVADHNHLDDDSGKD